MTKIVQIIGTRPQYIKLIALDDSITIDTGQHYSTELTQEREHIDYQGTWKYSIRENVRNLMNQVPFETKLIVVYGDTFSTFVGALVAKRLGIKLAHIEAGVRTGVKTIEERIRIKVDSMSDILLCPTERARQAWVGYGPHYYNVGCLMYDKFLKRKRKRDFILLTLHRRENLHLIETVFRTLNRQWTRFIAHPHTIKYIKEHNIEIPKNIWLMPSMNQEAILEMITRADYVVTDSGGLMREAYWTGVPVRVIGNNPWPEIYAFGDGHAGEKIKQILKEELDGEN